MGICGTGAAVFTQKQPLASFPPPGGTSPTRSRPRHHTIRTAQQEAAWKTALPKNRAKPKVAEMRTLHRGHHACPPPPRPTVRPCAPYAQPNAHHGGRVHAPHGAQQTITPSTDTAQRWVSPLKCGRSPGAHVFPALRHGQAAAGRHTAHPREKPPERAALDALFALSPKVNRRQKRDHRQGGGRQGRCRRVWGRRHRR